MTDLTGKKIANTYKDILTVDASATNSGLDNNLRKVQDGAGNSSSLKLSQTDAAFTGNVSVNGNMTVQGTFQPNTINTSQLDAVNISATNITTDTLTAGTLTFQDVSVSSLRTGDLYAATISAGTISATNINATNITVGGDNVATSSALASASATLESHINTVSITLSSTNITLQTSIANSNSAIAALSATMATSISNKVSKSGDTMTGDLSFGDNNKAIFGAGSDLQIFHDGSHSNIKDAGTGNLRLQGDNLALQNSDATKNYAVAVNGGAIDLRHNNNVKLATTPTGIDVTGNATFGDNDKAIFGAGSDLQIYHDGSHSYITDAGQGDLRISGSSLVDIKCGDDVMFRAIEGGATQLRYDGDLKIATTSTGVDVTGDLTSSGRIKTTDGLFQADAVNQRFRQYSVASGSGNQAYLLGMIQTNGSINGGVTGVVKAAYDPGDSITNVNIHFAFSQRNGTAKGQWWYEHTDDDAGTDVVSVKLIDDGSNNYYVWLDVGDFAQCFIETAWRQVDTSEITDSGTLTESTITSGTTLFDTANDPTSEHHVGKLYAHDDVDVTGTVTADGLTVVGSGSAIRYNVASSNLHTNPTLHLENQDTTDGNVAGIMLSADNAAGVAGSAYIYAQSETANQKGNLLFAREDGANNPTTSMKLSSNGDISFYEDTGTTAKLTWDASEEHLKFADNGKAIFGAGNDLEILHDGTNSVIRDNGPGNLSLTTNGSKIGFYDQANGQFLAEAFTGAGFRLYYDGSQKFVTQPNGIDVTGTVTADGLTVEGTTTLAGDFNVEGSTDYGVEFRGTDPTVDKISLQSRFRDDTDAAYWGGSNVAFIRDGNWQSSMQFDTAPDYDNRNGLTRIKIAPNGDISFYDGSGTSQSLFWDASAERLGLGTSSPTRPLHVYTAIDTGLYLQSSDSAASMAMAGPGGSVLVGQVNGKLIFYTGGDANTAGSSATERMRITDAGLVGIGTSSPSANLHIKTTASSSGSEEIALRVESNPSGGTPDRLVELLSKNDGTASSTYGVLRLGDQFTNAGVPSKAVISASGTSYFNGGNVGIGTTSPATTLDVNGGIATSDNITMTKTNGAITIQDETDNTKKGQIQQIAGRLILRSRSGESNGNITFEGHNSQEYARFTSSGYLGIGTTSPSRPLHVYNELDTLAIFESTDFQSRIEIKDPTGSSELENRGGILNLKADSLNVAENSRIEFSVDNSEKMRIDSNGNVGIGTTSPATTLDVNGTVTADNYLYLRSPTGSAFEARSEDSYVTLSAQARNLNYVGNRHIFLGSDFSERMRIESSGNVGIGTSSPTSSLHIVNSGLAAQLRISNTTADATTKYGTVLGSHYTNSEEPITGMLLTSNSSSTGGTVSIGGGISSANAVNNIVFYTAANNTTLVGTERLRIDSSGNVGIGTSSPADKLHIEGNIYLGASSRTIYSGGSANLIFQNNTGNMIFSRSNGSSESMRIDSSGNLLVGTTSYNNDNAGIGLGASNFFYATRSSNLVGSFNRLSSDGAIIDFRKDSTTVGTIGSQGGSNLYIEDADAGLRFSSASDEVAPCGNGGANRDNAINLGASNNRFKDLHLGGTAYVGGKVEASNVNPDIITVGVGKFAGDGTSSNASGISYSRTATGSYTISFSTARPDADYIVTAQVVEPSSTLDSLVIHVIDGTQATTGFDVQIHEGDNGTSPGTLRDRDFYIVVHDIV
jgi:hypothetical protein